jgi:hypothetical protein
METPGETFSEITLASPSEVHPTQLAPWKQGLQ